MKNNIKVERARNSMTQAELAKHVGVSRQSINAIELGKYNLSTILALKIASIFKVKFDELFSLEKEDW